MNLRDRPAVSCGHAPAPTTAVRTRSTTLKASATADGADWWLDGPRPRSPTPQRTRPGRVVAGRGARLSPPVIDWADGPDDVPQPPTVGALCRTSGAHPRPHMPLFEGLR